MIIDKTVFTPICLPICFHTVSNLVTNLFPSGKPYIEPSVPGTATLIGNLSGYQLWNPAPPTVEKATLGFR